VKEVNHLGLLTDSAIEGYKDYTRKVIAYARYKVGGTYYKTGKPEIHTLPDGRIAVDVLIDHSVGGDITVTEIQLYDIHDKLWLKKPESIKRMAVQEGILYRFAITIKEEV